MKYTIQKPLFLLCMLTLLSACSSSDKVGDNQSRSDDTVATNKDLLDTADLKLETLVLPKGFSIDLFARVENARSMALSPSGIVYVGNRGGDKVYALRDNNGDFKADEIFVIAKDMRMPNGVAFKDGDLYVAEVSKLWKFPEIEDHLSDPQKELIYDDYPTDGHHGWKYIAFGPDGKLYIPVGAPCNICESKNEMFASISRMNPDGSDREIYAYGVRNTVGFDWHPTSGDLYFTDNGRDMMSDELPPCELNRVSEKGQHFGYPYCHAGNITDPEFGEKRPCEEFVQPVQRLDPHVAPLGMKFYTGAMFPEAYKNVAFIAEHGSWNRSAEAGHTGYKITTVTLTDGTGTAYEDFITGFLNKETNKAWGRPVDVLMLPDGSMLISDDLTGSIYRISYDK